jgi:uncharacterized protein YhdP
MKKLVKAVLIIVIVVIVLAILGVAAVAILEGRIVQKAVETAGTKTLNVGVTVGEADASILRGTVGLQNITVANPAGFQGPALLTLQQVRVTADTGSLLSNEMHIRDMRLSSMEVFVEQKALQNNLYEVIKPLREPRRPPASACSLTTWNSPTSRCTPA